MANFICASATKKTGVSKTNKPYTLLIVSGVLVQDSGRAAPVEFAIFETPEAPLPSLTAGLSYTPTFRVEVRDGKLSVAVSDLLPKK